jgi:hypothetical protein
MNRLQMKHKYVGHSNVQFATNVKEDYGFN